jgi:hypothetical protein
MNGRKTAAFWYDVDFSRPTAELAREFGVSVDAIGYHKRRIKRVGSMSEAKREAIGKFATELIQVMWSSARIKPSKPVKSEIKYAVLYEAKETLNRNGAVHTSEGELFWVIRDQRNNLTSYAQGNTGKIPGAVREFVSMGEANLFMKVWDSYPWYAQPRSWKVIAIRPRWTTIQSGWEFLSNEP